MLRQCSFATNLLTSPKKSFRLLCYSTVPFWPTEEHFCIHPFDLINRTATNIATSDFGTVPERRNKNEERSSRNEERNRNTPNSSPNFIQMKSSKITSKVQK